MDDTLLSENTVKCTGVPAARVPFENGHSLSEEEIERYNRQILLPEFGPSGQEKLRKSSALIVGLGGLGCPVALYLAGAGIGTLGLMDADTVAKSNLHRQIGYKDSWSGKLNKAVALQKAVHRLNSLVKAEVIAENLSRKNAPDVISRFDVIVDCSDNVATKLLINDVCVVYGKPLVSGSAVGWDGQLSVYLESEKSPCYRCVFPEVPPAYVVRKCSDAGVVGPVVGVIGSMQALECLKVVLGRPSSFGGLMFTFDGLRGETRTMRLRGRQESCTVCRHRGAANNSNTAAALRNCDSFCGPGADPHCQSLCGVKLLAEGDRCTAGELARLLATDSAPRPRVIDLRTPTTYSIRHIQGSLNFPYAQLRRKTAAEILDELKATPEELAASGVVIVCSRGNESQLAVTELREKFASLPIPIDPKLVRDLVGGLNALASS